jgi:hypothetical protein
MYCSQKKFNCFEMASDCMAPFDLNAYICNKAILNVIFNLARQRKWYGYSKGLNAYVFLLFFRHLYCVFQIFQTFIS